MLKRMFFTLLCLCPGIYAGAQYENVWIFGESAGINFNTTPPTAMSVPMPGHEGCASLSDLNGNLLFYTNGSMVFDRTYSIMPDGIQLVSANTTSTSQGALIVPFPYDTSMYYVFSLQDRSTSSIEERGRLFYSLIDMRLNNGLGNIVQGRKGILMDSLLTEQMIAVPGENCDIWLLVVGLSGKLKAYKINASGISTRPVESDLLPVTILTGSHGYTSGCMDISPDRSMLAIAHYGNDDPMQVYNFDAGSGRAVSRILSVPGSYSASSSQYSVCFSPDNSKLYAVQPGSGSSPSVITQFDLQARDSLSVYHSAVQIASLPQRWALKRAVNNKIYGSVLSATSLDVIEFPDRKGSSCGYKPGGLELLSNTRSSIGLPNTIATVRKRLVNHTIYDTVICFAASRLLQPVGQGAGHIWNDGSSLTQRTVSQTGTYYVTYETACEQLTDTFIIVFSDPLPELDVHAACKNMENGRARFKTDRMYRYSFTWRNRGGTILSLSDSLVSIPSGYYTVHITSVAGCDTMLEVFIPEDYYNVSFEVDTLVCEGEPVVYTNTSDKHYTDFHWYFGDGAGKIGLHSDHTYLIPGNYRIMLKAAGTLCTDTIYQTITVDSIFAGFSFVKDREDLCSGEAVVMSTVTEKTMTDLLWEMGDGNHFATSDNYITHAYDKAGVFAVVLTAHFRACPDRSLFDTVRVYPLPLVNLGPDSVICSQAATVTLFNRYSKGEGESYLWSTGATSPSIKVLQSGNYSLTIKSSQGCATTETVKVDKGCYGNIPNVFTPNSDGINDYFFPRQVLSKNIEGFRMQIFNRWGQLLFETTRLEGMGWDGKCNNVDQPVGLYVYLIEFKIDRGIVENYTGNITLLR